jgi:hypothetical protein
MADMTTVLIVLGVVVGVALAILVVAVFVIRIRAGVQNVKAGRPERAAKWEQFRAQQGEGWREAKQSSAADWKKIRGKKDPQS